MKMSNEEKARMNRSIVEIRECSKLIKSCIMDISCKIADGRADYKLGDPVCIDEIVSEMASTLKEGDAEYGGMVMTGMMKILVAYTLKQYT